jgi:hypothetical protein
MRWAGHIARILEMKEAAKFLYGSFKGRDHSEDLDVDGEMILRWILRS